MIARAQETKQDLTILLLDFEKAYDRVGLKFFIWGYGLPQPSSCSQQAIFALYKSTSHQVLVGGELDNNFPITRLVIQRCHFTPYLFLWVEEAFGAFLNKNIRSL